MFNPVQDYFHTTELSDGVLKKYLMAVRNYTNDCSLFILLLFPETLLLYVI